MRKPTENFSNENNQNNNYEEENEKNYKTLQGENIRFITFAGDGHLAESDDLWNKGNKGKYQHNNRLEGEFATVERHFSKIGLFEFYGNSHKITSPNDVAYIFRQLENEATEHSFAVFIDKEKNYNVQWVGMGGISSAIIDTRVLVQGAKIFNATELYFIHNHPSGTLKASNADLNVLHNLKEAFAHLDISVQGIIINLNSGKYLLFNTKDQRIAQSQGKDVQAIEIFAFNRQKFLLPPTGTFIRSSTDIATFISQQKFGVAPKTGYIILNNASEVVANFFATKSNPEAMAVEIADLVTKYGGAATAIYTNETVDLNKYRFINQALHDFNIKLLDVVVTESSSYVIENYKSLFDEGLIRESQNEYLKANNAFLAAEQKSQYNKKNRKNQIPSNTAQLSLFGSFDKNNDGTQTSEIEINLKTHHNANLELSKDGIRERTEIHDLDRGGHGVEDGPGERQSKATLRDDQGAGSDQVPGNEGEPNISSIPEQNNELLSRANEDPYQQRSELISGGGIGILEPDQSSRTINYHNSKQPTSSGTFNKRSKYLDNINALDIVFTLNNEKRPATPAEQIQLAKYVGFGGLKEILLDPSIPEQWTTQSDQDLKPYVKDVYQAFSRLDPNGSEGLLISAKRSILNAHYTSYDVINAIYDAVNKAGFKGGNILEPSAGIGNFLAAMPLEMANNSNVTAIEMDGASGKILQKLFPTAETRITGFEKLNLPENNYELIISNVPFGDIKLFDNQLAKHKDSRYREASNNLHNYFFAKSILLAKPGALVAFITSRFTLDSKQNNTIRQLISDSSEFMGAIRLPDTAFKANAGTEVVSDIIFLRKFNIGEERKQKHQFINTSTIPFVDDQKQNGFLTYNEYFHSNPGHMLGKVEYGGLYSGLDFNLKGNSSTNLFKAITAITDKIFSAPVIKYLKVEDEKIRQATSNFIQTSDLLSIGNIVTLPNGFIGIIKGEVHIDPELDRKAEQAGINPVNIRNGTISGYETDILNSIGLDVSDFKMKVVEKLRVAATDIPKIPYIEKIRKLTKQVIFAETNNENDIFISKKRDELRETYEAFVLRFGKLLDKSNDKLLKLDLDAYLILSLERQDKITGKIFPSDILTQRTIHPEKQPLHTDNIQDAISISIQKFGKLNMNFISELMDKSYTEIMLEQKGDNTFIFIDENNNHFTRSEYLSGNVVAKLEIARAEVQHNSSLENNIEQLEKVQPKPIAAVDIYSPLHARWIPVNHVERFLKNELKTDAIKLSYSRSNDLFSVSIETGSAHVNAYASKRKSAEWIVAHALNGIEPVVKYTVRDENNNERLLLDPQDTQLAKELYKKIRSSWDDFKYSDITRRQDIARIYNRTFNNTVLRKFDGSHQQFPGLVGYVPMPHQKDAIFRNVQSVGGINDHMVGTGKTLIQIVTAMELRRLGTANKPMIIGLKSQIPQLFAEFKKSYPLAKVLFPTDKDFTKENRPKLLNNIATNDWDCIILSHDQFNFIRQPVEIQATMINELKSEIKEEINFTSDKKEIKQLEKTLYKYEQRLDQLQDYKKDDNVLDFQQLGVDFLMVDESQEFKNLEFITKKKNIRGLGNPVGSKRAFNMLIACRYLQDLHKGDKGVIFSSGTTISNSMAELYLLFKYLRPDKMNETGLTSFDKWASNFANDYSDLEYYMGKFKEVHRFREFTNLPELVTMYKEIADVRNNSNIVLDKPKADHKLIKIQPSETQLAQIVKLQEFIETKGKTNAEELGLTAGFDYRKNINPSFAILAINYAKKLSLDPRLINPSFEAGTKLKAAANNITEIYISTTDFKGTQLVFSDLGTPKSNNAIDNLFSFLEENTPQADMNSIFGENYFDLKKKPTLEMVKERASEVLCISMIEVDMLITEANTAEKFDVYNELKRLLVANGIPDNEIAFIHDFNTRSQKEKLFDEVNAGEVRIVLGSSKKLGTGVNVQKRIVGLHHLDILWNPAPMEQRNGRGERQGNWAAKEYLNNIIPIYYYATERTLDASMYYVVSQKANFIAQMKTSENPEQRTIKDVEEDVDMGSMAAELSGDPIFKEKASLQKRVVELTQLNKSFNQKKFDLEETIRTSTILAAHYKKQIAVLENNIPLLQTIPKDHSGENIFHGKIGTTLFEKVGEFGTGIVAEAEYAKKHKSAGAIFALGEVWGFKAVGSIKDTYHGKVVVRNIISPLGDKIAVEKELPGGELANGLQIKQAILDMPDLLEKNKFSHSTTLNNIETYKSQLASVFPYQEELLSKTVRLDEVSRIILAKLTEEQNEKQQPIKVNDENNQSKEISSLLNKRLIKA